LDDFTPYYTYFETDVHDIKVQENFASLTDFKIVSVRDDSIQIEAEAKIEYKIEVTVDDENTRWYDDDDKEYKYFETEIQIIEDEQIIPITFKIDIPLLDEDVPLEIMVDEINRGKSLHL
jgi:hypothetical protein